MHDTHTDTISRRRRLATLALLSSAAIVLSAQLGDDGADAAGAHLPAASADGSITGVLTAIDADGTVVLDPLRVLSGEEAQRAAEADGATPAGEPLPNDVYLDDPDHELVRLLTDERTTITGYDCAEGCVDVDIPRADLLDGSARFYGGSTPVVEIDRRDGVVTEIREVYLP